MIWPGYPGNEENEEHKNVIYLKKINTENGLRFGTTIYHIKDFVRIIDLKPGIRKYQKSNNKKDNSSCIIC